MARIWRWPADVCKDNMNPHSFNRCLFAFAVVALLGACTTIPRIPVPAELADSAHALDPKTRVRWWGDVSPPNLNAVARERHRQIASARPAMLREGAEHTVSYLAISGGGADGALLPTGSRLCPAGLGPEPGAVTATAPGFAGDRRGQQRPGAGATPGSHWSVQRFSRCAGRQTSVAAELERRAQSDSRRRRPLSHYRENTLPSCKKH